MILLGSRKINKKYLKSWIELFKNSIVKTEKFHLKIKFRTFSFKKLNFEKFYLKK